MRKRRIPSSLASAFARLLIQPFIRKLSIAALARARERAPTRGARERGRKRRIPSSLASAFARLLIQPLLSAPSIFSARAFVVSSVKENDGLPLGTYAVYFAGIEKVVKEGRMLDNGDYVEPETAPAVAMRYLSASTSGITLTVDGSFKTVEYILERD